MGISLWWLLLLWSMGSRARASVVEVPGLHSCSSQALEHRLNSLGTRAWLLRALWAVPKPGIKPVSPALAGRFFTPEPQGNPHLNFFFMHFKVSCRHQYASLLNTLSMRVISLGFVSFFFFKDLFLKRKKYPLRRTLEINQIPLSS